MVIDHEIHHVSARFSPSCSIPGGTYNVAPPFNFMVFKPHENYWRYVAPHLAIRISSKSHENPIFSHDFHPFNPHFPMISIHKTHMFLCFPIVSPGFSHRFPHGKSTHHPPSPPSQVDQQRYPVLLTEPPYNPTAKREKMVEAPRGHGATVRRRRRKMSEASPVMFLGK